MTRNYDKEINTYNKALSRAKKKLRAQEKKARAVALVKLFYLECSDDALTDDLAEYIKNHKNIIDRVDTTKTDIQ